MKKILICFFFHFFFFQYSQAGLIIEIDPNISSKNIKNIEIQEGNLIIYSAKGKKIIHLEKNVLETVLLWVNQKANGPFMFSYDNALVPGAGKYASACLPSTLSDAIFSYDVYAHSLGLGRLPSSEELIHPLVAKFGDDSKMPNRQFQSLMKNSNQSSAAIRYRQMMFKHLNRPECVGELTIRAKANSKGFPVKIEAETYRTLRSTKWYRKTDVFSPQDREIFSLPYLPLKKDMENRWDVYRETFKPMDELSSIVEAYAILDKIRKEKPQFWKKFITKIFTNGFKEIKVKSVDYSSIPSLDSYISFGRAESSWSEQCEQMIGQRIETLEEANTAIALKWDDYLYYDFPSWDEDLDSIAQTNKDIKAQLFLLKAKEARYSSYTKYYFNEFFELTKNSIQLFQLRVKGLLLLQEKIDYYESTYTWAEELYEKELNLLFADFIHSVNQECENDALIKSTKLDLDKWENFSQHVYSTGLLNLASENYGYTLPSEFIEAVASIHFHRGRAFQKGRTIAYTHAHFRFLKYLQNKILRDKDLENLLQEYRIELAKRMGLKEWEESKNRFNTIEYNNDYSDYSKQNNWLDGLKKIEGKLIALADLSTKKHSFRNSASILKKGRPGGILSKTKVFTLLLIDGKLLGDLLTITKYKEISLRVYGIPYDNGKSLKPIRLEYLYKGQWKTLDLSNALVSN